MHCKRAFIRTTNTKLINPAAFNFELTFNPRKVLIKRQLETILARWEPLNMKDLIYVTIDGVLCGTNNSLNFHLKDKH